MHESPRLRRLRNDLAALERLRDESSVFRFRATGSPAQHYVVEFHGKSLARVRGRVAVTDRHQVEIKLGASYPRTMPELRWLTPVYHPNISEIGMVCLGGYGTHWVPSLNLDELCGMLWDMARYHNYDVRSPYNRDAALWVANQSAFRFPVDTRPLRDLRAALGRVDPDGPPLPHADAAEGPVPEDAADAGFELEPDTPGGPAPTPDPGAKVARFVAFVRRNAESNRPAPPTPPPPAPRQLIFLDDPPAGPDPDRWSRLRAADEEILFIE